MLILTLINVQYSQKATFSFEKGLNHQNHSSGSLHLVNLLSKISDPPTPYCYLENPGFLRCWALETEFFVILDYFLPFYSLSNSENQI